MGYMRRANRSTGGGWENTIHDNANCSFIGSGYQNSINAASGASANFITIGGGGSILIGAGDTSILDGCFIGGGFNNGILANSTNNVPNSFIGGGANNLIQNSQGAFIGGGYDHLIEDSNRSFIGGGQGNNIESDYSGIASGSGNDISDGISYSSLGSFIGSGNLNLISAATKNACYSFIGSGYNNTIAASHSFIGSGNSNIVDANYSGTLTSYLGKTNWFGQHVHATGSFDETAGTVQGSHLVWWNEEIGETTFPLFLDGVSEEVTIVPGGAYSFDLKVMIVSLIDYTIWQLHELTGMFVSPITPAPADLSVADIILHSGTAGPQLWSTNLVETILGTVSVTVTAANVRAIAYGHIEEIHANFDIIV